MLQSFQPKPTDAHEFQSRASSRRGRAANEGNRHAPCLDRRVAGEFDRLGASRWVGLEAVVFFFLFLNGPLLVRTFARRRPMTQSKEGRVFKPVVIELLVVLVLLVVGRFAWTHNMFHPRTRRRPGTCHRQKSQCGSGKGSIDRDRYVATRTKQGLALLGSIGRPIDRRRAKRPTHIGSKRANFRKGGARSWEGKDAFARLPG